MAGGEAFDSAVRSSGDLAGVYEYDGASGYFYLYSLRSGGGGRIIGAIRVLAGTSDLTKEDVAVRWDSTESKVGLFIRDQLWAAFDSKTGANYGGDYRAHAGPQVPVEIGEAFQAHEGEQCQDG